MITAADALYMQTDLTERLSTDGPWRRGVTEVLLSMNRPTRIADNPAHAAHLLAVVTAQARAGHTFHVSAKVTALLERAVTEQPVTQMATNPGPPTPVGFCVLDEPWRVREIRGRTNIVHALGWSSVSTAQGSFYAITLWNDDHRERDTIGHEIVAGWRERKPELTDEQAREHLGRWNIVSDLYIPFDEPLGSHWTVPDLDTPDPFAETVEATPEQNAAERDQVRQSRAQDRERHRAGMAPQAPAAGSFWSRQSPGTTNRAHAAAGFLGAERAMRREAHGLPELRNEPEAYAFRSRSSGLLDTQVERGRMSFSTSDEHGRVLAEPLAVEARRLADNYLSDTLSDRDAERMRTVSVQLNRDREEEVPLSDAAADLVSRDPAPVLALDLLISVRDGEITDFGESSAAHTLAQAERLAELVNTHRVRDGRIASPSANAEPEPEPRERSVLPRLADPLANLGHRVVALWRMMDQTVPASHLTRPEISRGLTKRARRLDMHVEVTVVTLRREEIARLEALAPAPTAREWAYRWLVRGHWRRLHKNTPEERRTWIPGYVKGPEDKPFKATRAVYSLIR